MGDTRAAMTLRRILLVLALGTGACAKQGQVRTQMPDQPAPDLYHLCNDARYRSMCTPVVDEQTVVPLEQPVRVDTNITSPHAFGVSAG